MSDSAPLGEMIRKVPSYVFIKILEDLKKSCRMCQHMRADMLYLNDLEDGEQYDRCKDCCVSAMREKVLEQFKRTYKIDEKEVSSGEEQASGMAYL